MSKRLVGAGAALALAAAVWTPSAASADDPPECEGHAATVVGTEGPDDIVGTSEDEVIVALGGDDTITGDLLGDVVCAGEGDDTVVSPAYFVARGGPGNDRLESRATYYGTRLQGDEGNDELILTGGNGNLYGGVGDDLIVGGRDRDFIYPGPGNDTVDGGDGVDELRVEDAGYGPVRINLSTGIGRGQGRDSITGVEDINGTRYDDVLIGDDLENEINFVSGPEGRGLDKVRGRGGDDELALTGGSAFSGAGDDGLYLYFQGTPTDDYVDGGTGVDLIHYDHMYLYDDPQTVELDLANETAVGVDVGDDVVKRFEGAVGSRAGDILIGDEGDNIFDGFGGRDQIRGGGGSDILDGGSNFDLIFGEAGDDSLNGGPGTDTLDGGEGVDSCLQGENVTGCE